MRGALACVTYYARDYAGDWGYILKQSSNMLCESNGMSIGWILIHCKHNDIHRKNDGMCIA